METVASKLQETGQHIVKQHHAFVTRTRDAGAAFLDETRQAGEQLIGAVRTEAKRWRRFATQRAAKVQGDVRSALSIPAMERTVLLQVDGTLRALETRVRARLARLERAPAPKAARRVTNGKSNGRSRKAKPALPPMAA